MACKSACAPDIYVLICSFEGVWSSLSLSFEVPVNNFRSSRDITSVSCVIAWRETNDELQEHNLLLETIINLISDLNCPSVAI